MKKSELKRKIYELDFAIHELSLYLDTHPQSERAMGLLCEYRKIRKELIAEYEMNFGNYVVTTDDVPAKGCWEWLSSPWPWDNDFMEG